MKRLILHAPNVHYGGGFVLLQELLKVEQPSLRYAILDKRAQVRLAQYISKRDVAFVRPTIISRIWAEFHLWWKCEAGELALCFNGLPPLLPIRGQVVIFVQNRLLIEQKSLAAYPTTVRFRLRVERLWSRFLQARCSRYIVQTPSMAISLKRWLKREVPISVLAFAPEALPAPDSDFRGQPFNFVYVASGEPHKNHKNLIEAWRLLAISGQTPSLALTLDPKKYPALCKYITQFIDKYGLSVTNLGPLSSTEVDNLYHNTGAVIFPSTLESLGLPLIEASERGLPILAPELDYVRDVVEPAETFDPSSAISIARAVRRFLGVAEQSVKIIDASAFLEKVLQ